MDDEANLSWLFVRNETGIENSIKLATHYGAPKTIIDALKTKDVILSLYEKEDFEHRKTIEWEKYLIPTTVFESDDKYLSFFCDLIHEDNINPKYYYAFTKTFPDHGIDKDRILSYKNFLQNSN